MLIDEQTYAPGSTTDRKLKPSEAMRIGAALRPQCFGSLYAEGLDGIGSCALGAMWEGYGRSYREDNCKVYSFTQKLLGKWNNTVWHLNDNRKWTREKIADWLESVGL